jgi:hypothetical protein
MLDKPPELHRAATADERFVLGKLVGLNDEFLVEPISDGMGSFRVAGVPCSRARLAAELQLTDRDGTPLLVSLFVNESNMAAEVDVFRADFGQLQSTFEEMIGASNPDA